MKQFNSPLTVADLATISPFVSQLTRLVVNGAVKKPYDQPRFESISKDDLWQKLQLQGKTPNLNHWVGLGLPCSQTKATSKLIFDSKELLDWCNMMEYIIDVSAIRINKPMPETINIPSFFDNIDEMTKVPYYYQDCENQNMIFIDEEKSYRITEENKRMVLRGWLCDWGKTHAPYHPSKWRDPDEYWMLYWRYINWPKFYDVAERLQSILGLSQRDFFNAEVFFPEDAFFHSDWFGQKMSFDDFGSRMTKLLKPFTTYKPYVSKGFFGLRDNSKL